MTGLVLALALAWPWTPSVAVLGDSLTAGWGVERSFAAGAARDGRPGATSSDFVERPSALSASMVVIELGLNDAHQGVSPATFAANLQAITDRVEGRPLLVIAPTLRDPYAEVIRSLGLPVVDMRPGFGPDLLLPDGIHPNEAGHQLMAGRLWDALGR